MTGEEITVLGIRLEMPEYLDRLQAELGRLDHAPVARLAERIYAREEALADSIFGPESAQIANTLNSRAVLYRKTGRFSEDRPEARGARLRSVRRRRSWVSRRVPQRCRTVAPPRSWDRPNVPRAVRGASRRGANIAKVALGAVEVGGSGHVGVVPSSRRTSWASLTTS